MAYFAELDENNVVLQVIRISNAVLQEPAVQFPETDAIGQDYISNVMNLPGVWRQTSFNGSFRGTYAGQGYAYDEVLDQFIPPVIPE